MILESPVTSPKNQTKFKSSDDGTTSQRPKLEVCYTSGAVQITPDNSGQGVSGQTKTYAHTVTVGSTATTVDLTAVSSKSWPTRIYRDTDGDGQPDGGPITGLPSFGPNADRGDPGADRHPGERYVQYGGLHHGHGDCEQHL